MQYIDLSKYKDVISYKIKLVRLIWFYIWILFIYPLPRSFGSGWKRFLLRLFGARISKTAVIYSSTKIYMPWNLEMGDYSCLADGVECYNVTLIRIGNNSTISQRTFLCSASHDITKSNMPLIVKPITIEDGVWVAAEAFIAPGVTIHKGAVVGARACVFKDVEPWTVVGGNPARFLKRRELKP